MRRSSIALLTTLFVVALVVSLPLTSHSQTRDRFVISARAGGVNAVTGRASMLAHGESEWQQLTIKEDLETGDVVKTGVDGRVEMLLNPGSYLRIGENSEFELADSSLENLEVRLIKGTAIVEATGADDTPLLINITTPHTKLAIIRRGLYRLNVVPGDATELIVRKGRVMLDRSHTKIKGGNKVVFNNENFFIAKLQKADKKKLDNLEVWSKERAETVAQANRKLRGRDMAVLMAGMNDHWARGFSASHSGFWIYSSRAGCYTFVPFLLGWGSPYGSSYSSAFFGGYGYSCCGGLYGQTGAGSPNVAGTSGGSSSAPTSPRPVTSPRPMPAPSESRSLPPALQGRVERHRDRLPNSP